MNSDIWPYNIVHQLSWYCSFDNISDDSPLNDLQSAAGPFNDGIPILDSDIAVNMPIVVQPVAGLW